MKANELRNSFLQYFESKQHKIVPSAPMVIKNDPTLMFTNAGMNQFKDLFLGHSEIKFPRIADSQKCLRVSGKHNDLEEVGHDTYHHTMFEMLGNWSFGDYFKKEAIEFAWEYLIDILKIDSNRLYATVFEGSSEDNLEKDEEAYKFWYRYLPKNRILNGSKKDNFWEMGDTGPCGPCSEIHIDLRDDDERSSLDGAELVNKDHPLVIEIWNLVFIQFNRRHDGSLETLPSKHVDTGMGFERLAMVVQGKKSNYDTNIFQPLIQEISSLTGFKYGAAKETDIAMRVISDHLRTISFSVADGQLPSNNKAGYVIRRILRRAVRYAYTFLHQKEPFMYKLLPVLIEQMSEAYPELQKQGSIIKNVIFEEEQSFLRTLDTGIKLLEQVIEKTKADDYRIVSGQEAFKLYDTYGFPLDLTELILKENDLVVNRREFDEAMAKQKATSKADATMEAGDWTELDHEDETEEFIGYDHLQADVHIVKYRQVKQKGKSIYHLVFNYTPFYAESGGQIGDKGVIKCVDGEDIPIFDTQKEHNLILHLTNKLPKNPEQNLHVEVFPDKRRLTAANHSATHLLHQALRHVLGKHVEQKGSLVAPTHLRFDFSHFQKMSDDEILQVEHFVNERIRRNYSLEEKRAIPMADANDLGAIGLFGEKYGDIVRVIKFGDSVELCGGTHVKATGEIGFFKITKESAIAAGIRRIEAITSVEAEKYIYEKFELINQIEQKFKTPRKIDEQIDNLINENIELRKQLDNFSKQKTANLKQELKQKVVNQNGINYLAAELKDMDTSSIKDLMFQLKGEINNLFFASGANVKGKAILSVIISDNLVQDKKLHAGNIVREAAKLIQGGGGGQAFYATAGGKNAQGIPQALEKALELAGK